jgi:hypothetical protein
MYAGSALAAAAEFVDASSDSSITEECVEPCGSRGTGSSAIDGGIESVPWWDSPWTSPRKVSKHRQGSWAETEVHRDESGDDSVSPRCDVVWNYEGPFTDARADRDSEDGFEVSSVIGSLITGAVAAMEESSLGSACGDGFGAEIMRRQRSDSEFPEPLCMQHGADTDFGMESVVVLDNVFVAVGSWRSCEP